MSRWIRPCSWAYCKPDGGLADQLAGVRDRQRAMPSHQFVQIQPVHVLHHQEPLAVDFAGVVGLDDVGVVDPPDRFHLAFKAGDGPLVVHPCLRAAP